MKSLLKEMQQKFKVVEQDQDKDGDKDFADVMIARMVKSGMSREDAIKKVKDKEYNEAVTVSADADQQTIDKAKDVADKSGEDLKFEGLRGQLDEPYYIEVSIRDARKALNLYADIAKSFEEITTYGSNVYASFNQGEIEDLMGDFAAHDIDVIDSNTDWEGDFKNPEPDEDIDEANATAAVAPHQMPAFKKKKDNVAEAMDKKYEALIESYRDYALGDSKMSPDKRVKETIREVSKKLQEIEQMVQYSSRLKTESGLSRDGYGASVNKALTKISERLIKISERVRSLGE